MWVKKTEAEYRADRRKKNAWFWRPWWLTLLVSVIIAMTFMLYYGPSWFLLTPAGKARSVLDIIILGALFHLIAADLWRRWRRTYHPVPEYRICPSCFTVIGAKDAPACTCGTEYIDLDRMKQTDET